MDNFGTLYKTEIKKILLKRSVWIMLIIGMALMILSNLSDIIPFGGEMKVGLPDGTFMTAYEVVETQKNIGESISGEKIDDELLAKMRFDISTFLSDKQELNYEGRNASETYPGIWFAARKLGYEDLLTKLYTQFQSAEDINAVLMECTAEDYYRTVRNNLNFSFEHDELNEEEKAYWYEKYDSQEKPVNYEYAAGYNSFAQSFHVYIWFVFLLISISLAGEFSDETAYRTDAVILSSRNGRKPICKAKLCAGITVAIAELVIVLAVNMAVCLGVYGNSGWNAPLLMIIQSTAWNITVGQAVSILIGLALILSVLFSLFTMLISQISGKSVTVMAVQFAVFFIGLFEFPYDLGLITKLWNIRPTNFLMNYSFMEYKLFKVGGQYLNEFQMAGILYPIIIAIALPVIYISYQRMMLKSR